MDPLAVANYWTPAADACAGSAQVENSQFLWLCVGPEKGAEGFLSWGAPGPDEEYMQVQPVFGGCSLAFYVEDGFDRCTEFWHIGLWFDICPQIHPWDDAVQIFPQLQVCPDPRLVSLAFGHSELSSSGCRRIDLWFVCHLGRCSVRRGLRLSCTRYPRCGRSCYEFGILVPHPRHRICQGLQGRFPC